ncbi:MAG TPA: hypothetical protein VFW34_02400 [Candidatus Rubrimentiphilum sp.]|nr:hypothetical protein [Candidatus Rubrimentiphilum sp.]
MAIYSDELAAARHQGREAFDAMEAWVSAPADAPEVPGAVLEAHARKLRESRERLRALREEHGERDDIAAALVESEEFHRSLGLTIRDKPDTEPETGAE